MPGLSWNLGWPWDSPPFGVVTPCSGLATTTPAFIRWLHAARSPRTSFFAMAKQDHCVATAGCLLMDIWVVPTFCYDESTVHT